MGTAAAQAQLLFLNKVDNIQPHCIVSNKKTHCKPGNKHNQILTVLSRHAIFGLDKKCQERRAKGGWTGFCWGKLQQCAMLTLRLVYNKSYK